MSETTSDQLVPLDKLRKDIKIAAATMTPREARYLVDLYYQMQDNRIRAAGQIRSMEKGVEKEPHQTLDWVMAQSESLETSIKSVLGEFAKNRAVGAWSQSICGIGPVISAGLIANIGMRIWRCRRAVDPDVSGESEVKKCGLATPCSAACGEEDARTVSSVWRYAGLDPTVHWGKGEKRPWNGALKRLCWLIGQSFVKVSTNKNDFYGQFYVSRKLAEIASNDAGKFAGQAAQVLERKKIGKSTDAYAWYAGCYPAGTMGRMYEIEGAEPRKRFLVSVRVEPGAGQSMLPPAHIQQRSERYAVKLFLAHWFDVAYYDLHQKRPLKPYVLDVLGHVDEIQVPNWPF